MSLNDRVALGASILALLAALARQALLWNQRLNLAVFVTVVRKLLMARNGERALKLCAAAPQSAFVATARALIELVSDPSPLRPDERLAKLADAWRARRAETEEKILAGRALAWAAVALALGAWSLGTSPKAPWLVALVAAALALALEAEWKTRRLRADLYEQGLEFYRALQTVVTM